MKIRLDFVTNSSSSSFILGEPNADTTFLKDAKKYLNSIEKRISSKVGCEHIVDFHYDPNKDYDPGDIMMVIEAINWYNFHLQLDRHESEGHDYWTAYSKACDDDEEMVLRTDSGELFHLDEFKEDYTPDQVKAILDYAHQNFGEVLCGNIERPFLPYEAFDVVIEDDNIRYKCNHMG